MGGIEVADRNQVGVGVENDLTFGEGGVRVSAGQEHPPATIADCRLELRYTLAFAHGYALRSTYQRQYIGRLIGKSVRQLLVERD